MSDANHKTVLADFRISMDRMKAKGVAREKMHEGIVEMARVANFSEVIAELETAIGYLRQHEATE